MFAYCGLVGNPHLAAKVIVLLPFQRQPRDREANLDRRDALGWPEHSSGLLA